MGSRTQYSYDLFISYAEADSAWVQGFLLPALGLPEGRTISRRGFRPGAAVVTEFERAVTDSRYTLLILSPAYLADEWSSLGEGLASYLTIDRLQERLIPLRLQPCELPLRINFRVGLDCTEEVGWKTEIGRLRALLELEQPAPVPAKIECPYPGMVPFRAEDARFFHGREAEIDDLLQRLRHQRFLMVIGGSGSGKSSLINAGLLPKLTESTYFPPGYWLVRTMWPGSQPVQSLSQVVGADLPQPAPALTSLLASHPLAERLLLVIDQFEELFTQASREDQGQFIAALQALRATESCALVIAIRGDFFWTDLTSSDLWPVPDSERLEIYPLRDERLRAAIEKPAAREGVYLEPGLVQRLLDDTVNQPGVLPLVQETMRQLWEKMEGRFISMRAYKQLGDGERSGLAGALVTKANATLGHLARRSQLHETIAHRIFLRLVQFGEGRPDTRRRQPEAVLRSWDDDEVFDEVLEHLAQNRLVTVSQEDQDRKVDIAHEALFTEWPALEERVREWRRPELMRRRLEGWAADWISRDCDPKALLNPVQLSQAEEWLNSPAAGELGYSQAVTELVAASRAALDEEAARQVSARRFRLVALAAISLLIIVVLAAVAVGQLRVNQEQEKAVETAEAFGQAQATLVAQEQAARETADAERKHAEDLANDLLLRQLILKSERLLNDRYDQSLPLSIEAFRLADTIETRDNLLRVLRAWPQLIRYIPVPEDDTPTAIAFSPDGETLVALTLSGLRFWDAGTGVAVSSRSMVFNDSRVATRDGIVGFSSQGDTILLWDPTSRSQPRFLSGQPASGSGISSDGRIKASFLGNAGYVSSSDVISLEDAGTGEQIGTLMDRREMEYGYMLTFSPDSQTLAAASGAHGEIRETVVLIWELQESLQDYWESRETFSASEAERLYIPGDEYSEESSIANFVFSSDGRYLAANVQKSVDVHYLLSPSFFEMWQGEAAVTSLTSECDGTFAVGREDGEIVFFREGYPSRDTISPFHHPGRVEALVVAPDCRRLASLGSGVIVLWDLRAEDVPQLFELIDTRPEGASFAAWDSSGEVGSVCSRRAHHVDPMAPCVQSAIYWDNRQYEGFEGIVTSLAESPDGITLAAGVCSSFWRGNSYYEWGDCGTGEVWLWPGEPNDGMQLGSDRQAVIDLIFSPDGKGLASVFQDGTIMFWDVDLESWIARACYRVNQNLTSDDWTFLTGTDRSDRPACSSLEGPDRSGWASTLESMEPLLPTPALTFTPMPTRIPTPTATP